MHKHEHEHNSEHESVYEHEHKSKHESEHAHEQSHEHEKTVSRLALGTVQLGLPYGVANRKGQPSPEDACEIVRTAFEHGVRTFDTAQAYGESESVLGRCFRSLGISRQVKVISKLHPDLDYQNPACLTESVLASIQRLGVDSLYGLMLHRASWLSEWDKGLGSTLLELKKRHLVSFLGVSTYTPQDAHNALGLEGIDIIQSPFNIFDRRLIFSGVLDRAHQLKKQVFLRSIFLQGLILLPMEDLSERLFFARQPMVQLDAFCREHGLGRKEFALDYAWQRTKKRPSAFPLPPGERGRGEGHCIKDTTLVMGVESKEQMKENIALASKNRLDEKILDAWDSLELPISQKFINPSLWAL